jgi:hypothetical protein
MVQYCRHARQDSREEKALDNIAARASRSKRFYAKKE